MNQKIWIKLLVQIGKAEKTKGQKISYPSEMVLMETWLCNNSINTINRTIKRHYLWHLLPAVAIANPSLYRTIYLQGDNELHSLVGRHYPQELSLLSIFTNFVQLQNARDEHCAKRHRQCVTNFSCTPMVRVGNGHIGYHYFKAKKRIASNLHDKL